MRGAAAHSLTTIGVHGRPTAGAEPGRAHDCSRRIRRRVDARRRRRLGNPRTVAQRIRRAAGPMGPRRPARHADVAIVARGGTLRHGDPGGTVRGIGRQCAPDRQDRVHRRHLPLRDPAAVGQQSSRHHVRGTPRGRSHHRVDDDGRRPDGDVVRHAGPVVAAHRSASLGHGGHALRRQVTRRAGSRSGAATASGARSAAS